MNSLLLGKNEFVEDAILLAILLLTTGPCLSQTTTDGKRIFIADDRISALMPDRAELAQPLEIPIDFTDANVTKLVVYQHGERDLENKHDGKDVSLGRIVRDDGLKKTVEIIPLNLGTIQVNVMAFFADGGISQKAYPLRVVPSSKGLQHFYLNQGSSVFAIVLEEKQEDRQKWLSPEVHYYGLDYPIYLPDSTQLKFTVAQPKDRPVIRLEPNGMLLGLRPGSARITADFDGVTDTLTVTVYDRYKAPIGIGRDYCADHFARDFETWPNMKAEDRARRVAQQKELRTYLWSNWVQRRRGCAGDLVYNRTGDSVTNSYLIEPDEKGTWTVHVFWKKFQNWKPSNGEFRAYSVQRVIRKGGRNLILKDDEEHAENDYVLVFKDSNGKTIMSY